MKFLRRAWPYLLLGVLIVVNTVALTKRQALADWWRLRGYTPAANIKALADQDAMTPYARKLLYVNHPSLESKESFNAHCADKAQDTAVLGCYYGDRRGIYIYAVTDPRLEGVRQVTAAHEMLHQAYDRLTAEQQKHINSLLEQYNASGQLPPDIKAKLDSYQKQPSTDMLNEMHSIFGTEVRNLPPELEAYYKRYFSDRLKVVSLSEAYRGEFTRRQELVNQYDAQLAVLKQQISTNRATLEEKINYLKSKEKEIGQDAAEHNQAAYEADIHDYNNTVTQYNALLGVTRGLIDQHNQIVSSRNELAVQEQQLQQALDSRLNSPPAKQ
jgi:hypothetical protein